MSSSVNPDIILSAPVAPPLRSTDDNEKLSDSDGAFSIDKTGLDDAGLVSDCFLRKLTRQFLQTVNVDVDAVIGNATEADFARVRRKIDWRVLPLLYFTYALQNIDKSTLGYASVFTFQQDLGLVGKQ